MNDLQLSNDELKSIIDACSKDDLQLTQEQLQLAVQAVSLCFLYSKIDDKLGERFDLEFGLNNRVQAAKLRPAKLLRDLQLISEAE